MEVVLVLWVIKYIQNKPAIREILQPIWLDGTIPLVIGMFTFHVAIYSIWPKFWWAFFEEQGFIRAQIIIGVGIYLALQNNKAAKILGSLIIVFGIIGMSTGVADAIDLVTQEERKPPNDLDEVRKYTVNFWGDRLSGSKDMDRLLRLAEKRGYLQYDKDGVAPIRDGSFVCLWRIDENYWLEQSTILGSDYSLYTTEGCNNMAWWIYTHAGIDELLAPTPAARRAARLKPMHISAPPPNLPAPHDWSDIIVMHTCDNSDDVGYVHAMGPIKIRRDDGTTVDSDIGEKRRIIGCTTTLQFQSRPYPDGTTSYVDVEVLRYR